MQKSGSKKTYDGCLRRFTQWAVTNDLGLNFTHRNKGGKPVPLKVLKLFTAVIFTKRGEAVCPPGQSSSSLFCTGWGLGESQLGQYISALKSKHSEFELEWQMDTTTMSHITKMRQSLSAPTKKKDGFRMSVIKQLYEKWVLGGTLQGLQCFVALLLGLYLGLRPTHISVIEMCHLKFAMHPDGRIVIGDDGLPMSIGVLIGPEKARPFQYWKQLYIHRYSDYPLFDLVPTLMLYIRRLADSGHPKGYLFPKLNGGRVMRSNHHTTDSFRNIFFRMFKNVKDHTGEALDTALSKVRSLFAQWGSSASTTISEDVANGGRWRSGGRHLATYVSDGQRFNRDDLECLSRGEEPDAFPEWKTPIVGNAAYQGRVETSYRVHQCTCNWHADYVNTMTYHQ